jgi:phage gp36-like protein
MFLNLEDYIVVSSEALKVVEQCKTENRERAEKTAIEEISGYIRERYDLVKIFSTTGEDRNAVIVMYACDIALYHLVSSVPGRGGYEIRKERYDRAIKWLEGVQKGAIMPGLPTLTGENGEQDINNPIKYGTGIKNSYDW